MTKKIIYTLALIAALALLFAGPASAQDISKIKPTATIGEQVLTKPTQGVLKSPFSLLNQLKPGGGGGGTPPAYCSPCLFYGGNNDPSNPNTNGLWDNNSAAFGINGAVYSPFAVPKGAKGWNVTGLIAVIQYFPYPPTINDVAWSIWTGVQATGTPSTATLICSGTDFFPSLTDTGRLFFGFYEEFATQAHVNGCPTLDGPKSGPPSGTTTYWQVVQPETSVFQFAYESNVPDTPPPFAYGPAEPVDDSFFYAPAFGFPFFAPAQNLGAFHIFSAGVEGTSGK